jgi:hypothetical protein
MQNISRISPVPIRSIRISDLLVVKDRTILPEGAKIKMLGADGWLLGYT